MSELFTAISQIRENFLAGRKEIQKREKTGKYGIRDVYPLPEQEQILKYAEAFEGLARLFQELPCQKERLGDRELEEMFRQVQERLCRNCSREEDCWGEHYFQTGRVFYEMICELEESGQVSEKLIRIWKGTCIQPDYGAEALTREYEEARRELLWKNRMLEQRAAAGEQVCRTAELLGRLADGFVGVPKLEQELWKKLRREFKYLGIQLGNIRVFLFDGERPEIYLTLRSTGKSCVSARTVGEILSDCCQKKMCPSWNCHGAVLPEYANFHFVPDTRYQMFCGVSRITKAGELVSGDNYALLQKETGKVVMSLADGMGSGVGACRESEKVIELLEQFLEAGFPQETAVRMINSCMLLQNREQMYSTIDLCMIDLYNAKCDLMKSGAADTFLCHGEEIEVIHSSAYPPGVMQQADYECVHRQLSPGDTVIMVTDGVLEAFSQEEGEEGMKEVIRKAACQNAKEYARRLMERVYLMQKLQARDDMTVLVGTIWEK